MNVGRVYTWGVEQLIVRHSLLFVRKNYFGNFQTKGIRRNSFTFQPMGPLIKCEGSINIWEVFFCLCGTKEGLIVYLERWLHVIDPWTNVLKHLEHFLGGSSSFMFSFRKSVLCSIKEKKIPPVNMSSLCFFSTLKRLIHSWRSATLAVTHSTCLTQALTGSVGMWGISNYSQDAELKYLHLD